MKRIYLAVLLAPPISLATGFLATGTPLISTALYVLIGLQVAYPIAVALGFLLLRYSRNHGKPSLRTFVVLSAIGVILFWAVVFWLPVFPELRLIELESYVLSIVVASVFSAVFWRIAFPRSAA